MGFFEWGFDARGWAETTRREYAWRVAAAARWFEGKGLNLDEASLPQLRDYLFSTVPSAVNRNRIRAALVGYGRYLADTGIREDFPAALLPRLREPRGVPKPLERDEATHLLDEAVETGPMWETLVALYLVTGLRRSELARLKWSEIHGEWAHLLQKGSRSRTVFLNAEALAALASWRSQVSPVGEWVFPSPRIPGRPVTANWVWRKIRELGVDAGVNDARPHRLRHTFGSDLYELTGDIAMVQQALGHASLASTQVYTLVKPVAVADAVSRLTYRQEV